MSKEIVWERKNLINWLQTCKGELKFIKSGEELEKQHKIMAVCTNNESIKKATFRNIGDDDTRMLLDDTNRDWFPIITKFGNNRTKVELKHDNPRVINIRIRGIDDYDKFN